MNTTTTASTVGRRVRVVVLRRLRRASSFNGQLAALAARAAQASGADVDLATLRDFDGPTFDADVLADRGLPAGARAFPNAWRRPTGSSSPRPSTTSRCRAG